MEKALREYANREIDGADSVEQIKRDLLAIAGDEHYFVAMQIGIDKDTCAVCKRDIRNPVHRRS